jgi:hypothetical protein
MAEAGLKEAPTTTEPAIGRASVEKPSARVYQSATHRDSPRRRPQQPGRVYKSEAREELDREFDAIVADAAQDLRAMREMSTADLTELAKKKVLAQFELKRRSEEKPRLAIENPSEPEGKSADEIKEERQRELVQRARTGYIKVDQGDPNVFGQQVDQDNLGDVFENMGAHLRRLGRTQDQTDSMLHQLLQNRSLITPIWRLLNRANSPTHFAKLLQSR